MTSMSGTQHNTTEKESRKLTREEEEKLTNHLYTNSIENRKKSLEAIEAKIYRTEASRRLTKEEMEESAVRQATTELEMRRRRREELVKKVHKEEEPVTMDAEEVEASLRRMYEEPIRIRKANMETLEKKHAPAPEAGRRLTGEQQKALGDRLCVPKKTTYTDEEINKIYGF